MKKTNIIILIMVIILTGLITNYIINKNKNTIDDAIIKKGLTNTNSDFSIDNENCKKIKNIFDTVPHLTTYKEYNLKSVTCADTGVIIIYNNLTHSKYDMRTILNKDSSKNKFIQNVGTAGHDVEEVIETIGSEMNNLKRFENTNVIIKNTSDYNDVSYVTTYKNEYILTINVKGEGLTDKTKVNTYLEDYLESFDLSNL